METIKIIKSEQHVVFRVNEGGSKRVKKVKKVSEAWKLYVPFLSKDLRKFHSSFGRLDEDWGLTTSSAFQNLGYLLDCLLQFGCRRHIDLK